MDYDILITSGTLIDGRRSPRHRADVGIRDGVITAIGDLSTDDADQIIDAEGMIVAPGVIDLHTHYDSQIYWDPWCTISGWHGVTSVLIGNCGFGFAPVRPEHRERSMLTLARNEAVPMESMREGMAWNWETYPEFLDSLETVPKGVNVASFVGIAPLMTYVMGEPEEIRGRPATRDERSLMRSLLDEAMEVGAHGWSAQLLGSSSIQRDYDGEPMVTDLMASEDLIWLAETLRERADGVIQMIGPPKLAEELAERSGRPVIFNVLAATTDQHGAPAQSYQSVIRWLDEANERGNRVIAHAVTCSVNYQFTLEDWNLFDTSPLWRQVTLGDRDARIASMRDPALRTQLRAEYDAGRAPLAGGGTESDGERLGVAIADLIVESIPIDDPSLKRWEGHTLREIADTTNRHCIDVLLDLSLQCDLRAGFASTPRPPDARAMREIANCPYSVPGLSDGGAHTKFLTMGSYPTEFLATWVRDHAVMSLEDAHWRLSAYSAQVAGIHNRGWIDIGMPADIIVYDLDALALSPPETAADFPGGAWRRVQGAEGYRATIVNGVVTFDDGICTGATPGVLIRHGTR